MRSIMITGATGFVGSQILKYILDNNIEYDVIVCPHVSTLNETRIYNQIGSVPTYKNIVFAQGNLTDYEFVARTINAYEIDTIFHMAAESIVRIAKRDPITCFNSNIKATWNLLEASRQSQTVTAFVGASSDKAYGTHAVLPYREDFALQALNTYDASKACADILIRSYAHNYGLNTVVTRACNIYGPGDFNYSRIIPNSIRRLMNDESPLIWKGVNQYIREFVYVEDMASATVLLGQNAENLKGQAFNISTNDIWEVEKMVNRISEEMNKPIKATIVDKELDFLEIPAQYLDGSKLKSLGWEPKYSIENNGLKNTVEWYVDVFERGIK